MLSHTTTYVYNKSNIWVNRKTILKMVTYVSSWSLLYHGYLMRDKQSMLYNSLGRRRAKIHAIACLYPVHTHNGTLPVQTRHKETLQNKRSRQKWKPTARVELVTFAFACRISWYKCNALPLSYAGLRCLGSILNLSTQSAKSISASSKRIRIHHIDKQRFVRGGPWYTLFGIPREPNLNLNYLANRDIIDIF